MVREEYTHHGTGGVYPPWYGRSVSHHGTEECIPPGYTEGVTPGYTEGVTPGYTEGVTQGGMLVYYPPGGMLVYMPTREATRLLYTNQGSYPPVIHLYDGIPRCLRPVSLLADTPSPGPHNPDKPLRTGDILAKTGDLKTDY